MSSKHDAFVGRMVLGRYQIMRPLAAGGMGVVYLARTRGAGGFVRPVVIKRVLPGMHHEEMVGMFVREANVLASMRHPGVVSVIDFQQEQGEHLLVQEYIEGYNLAQWRALWLSRGQPFPSRLAVYVALQVLDALEYVHTLKDPAGKPLGIVHRDLTPTNVMIGTEGHVKLLDFGIASERGQKDSAKDGDGPTLKGKIAYLAPELLDGASPTPSSDVYSVALLLHEVLSGKNPFNEKDVNATLANVAKKLAPRLDEGRPDLPRALADVVAKGLAKGPRERFGTAQGFAEALRAAVPMSEPEVRAQLVARVHEDYADPAMTTIAAGNDLATLTRAWSTQDGAEKLSNPPPAGAATGERPTVVAGGTDPRAVNSNEGPTMAARGAFGDMVEREKFIASGRTNSLVPERRTSVAPERRSGPSPERTSQKVTRPTGLPSPVAAQRGAAASPTPTAGEGGSGARSLVVASWVAALAAVAALGVALFVYKRSAAPDGAAQFVVVQGSSEEPSRPTSGAGSAGNASARPRPSGASTSASASASAGGDPSTSAGPSGAGAPTAASARVARRPLAEPLDEELARFTREIARKERSLEDCAQRFGTAQTPDARSPITATRIDLDAEGNVTGVELVPSEEQHTPLGTCVAGVVRTVRFGRQGEGVTFRVPLSIRTRVVRAP